MNFTSGKLNNFLKIQININLMESLKNDDKNMTNPRQMMLHPDGFSTIDEDENVRIVL